jgi:hypothetical protein
MNSPLEIIDLKLGSGIGVDARETEALAALRCSLYTTARAIEDLSLVRITDHDQFLVAMQADLECRVCDSDG